jgi:hypothetical protein
MAGPYSACMAPMTTNPAQLPISATTVSGPDRFRAGRLSTLPVKQGRSWIGSVPWITMAG